jgi:hypothetical protein
MAAAAALALTPVVASAATITPADTGTNYDLLAESYDFDENFGLGTTGATLTYSFTNNSATTAAVTFFGVSVNQNSAEFTDGVSVDFHTFSADYAQGETTGENATFNVASGATATLTIQFGDVVDNAVTGGTANIDFTVEAALVPVPAAGLLLLTALGGIAVMRRRKAAA